MRLKSAGIAVPTLCHIKNLFPPGACRICSVEVEGQRGLIPSCAYPVYEGMVVDTNSRESEEQEKQLLNCLLKIILRIV